MLELEAMLDRMLPGEAAGEDLGLRLLAAGRDAAELGLALDGLRPRDLVLEHGGRRLLLLDALASDAVAGLALDVEESPRGLRLALRARGPEPGAEAASVREPAARRARLDDDRVHRIDLSDTARRLRGEREYRASGRTGVTLVKSEALRVVLEVLAAGRGLAEHVIRGPATVHVLQGTLDFASARERFTAGAGSLVVVPAGEPHEVDAREDATLLIGLSLDEPG
jgi:quercetin dioxygenase-like cupin family protein